MALVPTCFMVIRVKLNILHFSRLKVAKNLWRLLAEIGFRDVLHVLGCNKYETF